MTQIVITRDTFTENSTAGIMTVDGKQVCFTLEPRTDRSLGKPYCIPAGLYTVQLLLSPRFQMITPHVMDVPGFTEIEIHPGNTPSDTEGCTLVGTDRGVDIVTSSRTAFADLMKLLEGQGEIEILYLGGPLA